MLTVRQDLRIEQLASRIETASSKALYPVLGLVQRNSQYSMRRMPGPSSPGNPPHRHKSMRAGLGNIRYQVTGNRGIIGPIKFAWSNFFNQPVTRVHEMGGVFRSQYTMFLYPTRSYMYEPTKDLARRGLISRRFAFNIGRFL